MRSGIESEPRSARVIHVVGASIGTIIGYLRALPPRRTAPELFALGIAAAYYSGLPAGIGAAAGIIAASAALALLGLSDLPVEGAAAVPPEHRGPLGRARSAHRRAALLPCLAAFGAGLVSGSGALVAETAQSMSPAAAAIVTGIEGRLSADAVPAAKGGVLYPIRADRVAVGLPRARGFLSWPRHRPRLNLYAPERSPLAEETGMEAAAPFARQIPGGGLFATRGGAVHARLPDRAGFRIRAGMRAASIAALDRISGSAGGLVKALILGVRDEVLPEETEAFRDSGCIHVLSLSGQHLSILGGMVALVIGLAAGKGRTRPFSVLFVILFVWLAGPGPALLRSLLMLCAQVAAGTLDRPQSGSTILALSFAVQILTDPVSARGLSFTLSYLAMFGLIVAGPRCAYLLSARIPACVEAPLSAGMAAVFCTAPVSVAAFGELAPIGIAASALSGPLVVALMWWSILAAVAGAALSAAPFGGAAVYVLSYVTEFLYRALMETLRLAARAPKIRAEDGAARAALILVVVAIGLYVYARPHVDQLRGRNAPPRL